MSSRPRRSLNSKPMPPSRRNRRRSNSHRNRMCKPPKSPRILIGNGGATSAGSCASVSDKLEALKNLIPVHIEGVEDIKSDELFQETADYIVQLKTQILVLQKLINFYGCPPPQEDDQNSVSV